LRLELRAVAELAGGLADPLCGGVAEALEQAATCVDPVLRLRLLGCDGFGLRLSLGGCRYLLEPVVRHLGAAGAADQRVVFGVSRLGREHDHRPATGADGSGWKLVRAHVHQGSDERRAILVFLKKALAAIVVAFACVPVSQGAAAGRTAFPVRGVLTPGVSLAGVRIGDSVASVKHKWGTSYRVCPGCKDATWYYIYAHGEPLGAAVKFRSAHVVAVFTLGSPTGWHTTEGLLMGEEIGKAAALYGPLGWKGCIGYGAMTMRKGDVVTSIYTTGEAVYGFAITAPAEPVCQ
jgi:hypothetical protein